MSTKSKSLCISMTEKSYEDLKRLEDLTGKSKSRIVRDALAAAKKEEESRHER